MPLLTSVPFPRERETLPHGTLPRIKLFWAYGTKTTDSRLLFFV